MRVARFSKVTASVFVLASALSVGCGGDDAKHEADDLDASTSDAGTTGTRTSEAGTVARRDAGVTDKGDASTSDVEGSMDAGTTTQGGDAGTTNDLDASATQGDASTSGDASTTGAQGDAGADAAARDGAVSDAGSGNDAGNDAGPQLVAVSAKLVSFETGDPIATPHSVDILDNQTGAQLTPAIHLTSEANTGVVSGQIPPGKHIVWIHGAGNANTGTIDNVLVNVDPATAEDLITVFPADVINAAEQSAQVTARGDRAALTGELYWTKNGQRQGTIGCAKVFIDGKTSADTDQAERYNAAPDSLPVPLADQDQTGKSGLFFFGSLTKGAHTIRVSVDDGKTFVGSPVTFFVPLTNSEASSALKRVLVQLVVDLAAPADPTPASCNID